MINIPLTSSELGNLWQAYTEKSMLLKVMENFIEKSNDKEAKTLLESIYIVENKNRLTLAGIFQSAGSVIPIAFSEEDVNNAAPRLFGESFDLMYVRLMSKGLMNLYSLHESMSYRKDIRELYIKLTSDMQNTYDKTTEYLLEKEILVRPPIVPMPKEKGFIKGTNYSNGLSLFGKKRVLNAIEIGLIYQSLEANTTGVQLMTAFAQVAKEPDVKEYFIEGLEYAKEQVSIMSNLLLESDLPAPSTWAGTVTESIVSPFSDRLMMYNTVLLSIFGLGGNTVGAAFSFRNDLLSKLARFTAKTATFIKEGGDIMIKHEWMEQPPQAADRRELIES